MPHAQLTLAIETSNPSAASERGGPGVAVGLLHGDRVEVLGVEMLRSRARHDDDLMPAIDRLWSRLGRHKTEIRLVAVSTGPGGYTGIRIAVVAAKLIAEAAAARCVGVPSAWVVARRAPGRLASPFGVALASKGETTVVTPFASPTAPAGEPREIEAQSLAPLGLRALIADRHLPATLRDRCAQLGLEIVEPVFDPTAVLEAACALEPVDPAALAPCYGREPEAVRKWRELHGDARGRAPAGG